MMRIDNNRANLDAVRPQQAQAADAAAGTGTEHSRPSKSADQVSLSEGVRLAGTAVAAASHAPDLRPDVVERAKALLERGQLGEDPHRLADALIDRTLSGDQ